MATFIPVIYDNQSLCDVRLWKRTDTDEDVYVMTAHTEFPYMLAAPFAAGEIDAGTISDIALVFGERHEFVATRVFLDDNGRVDTTIPPIFYEGSVIGGDLPATHEELLDLIDLDVTHDVRWYNTQLTLSRLTESDFYKGDTQTVSVWRNPDEEWAATIELCDDGLYRAKSLEFGDFGEPCDNVDEIEASYQVLGYSRVEE